MSSKSDAAAIALATEVAGVLAEHGTMPCHPLIDETDDDGVWTLSITFRPTGLQQSFELVELIEKLKRLRDTAQLRGIATRYGIDPRRAESLLGQSDE